MHFNLAGSEPFSVKVELHIRVISQQAHRHRGVRDALADHEGGEPLPERVIVISRLPDGDLFRLPRFVGSDGNRLFGNARKVTPSRGSGILHQSDRVEFDNSRL